MGEVKRESIFSKFLRGVKNVLATMIEDQTELEIASTNSEFSHDMSRNAKLQKQKMESELSKTNDSQKNKKLLEAIEYYKYQEEQWKQCANRIEKWIFAGPVHHISNKCPEYEDFGL